MDVVDPASPDAGAAVNADEGDASADAGAADGSLDAGSAPSSDASSVYDGATVAPGALATCSASGLEAFQLDGSTCFDFTPTDMGLPDSGVNSPEYAVRPGTLSAAPTQLVLFFIGSGAKPGDVLRTGDPARNVYGAAVSDGDAILGLTYDNSDSINSDCGDDDGCYFPTRQSVILGTTETGSAITVTWDEGILERTAVSLRYLAASDPAGGWGAFLTTLDPQAPSATAIKWGSIIVSGHSQGGGHAAAIGKMFPVLKVVQLSSTCDEVSGAAASWTDGATGTWVSDPTQFYGLAAPSTITAGGVTGDSTCFAHAKVWANLGMVASHQDDAAATCGMTGDTHSASLTCVDNYDAWKNLYK